MKCVQLVGQGVPVRMSDELAHQIVVRDHDGEYCSKAFWQEWYRRHGTEPAYAKETTSDHT